MRIGHLFMYIYIYVYMCRCVDVHMQIRACSEGNDMLLFEIISFCSEMVRFWSEILVTSRKWHASV